MTRRTPLPGAAELFRPTARAPERVDHAGLSQARADHAQLDGVLFEVPEGTQRQKHTSKITVYVSDEELLALEQARLALRAAHGVAVDRGRVVREAVAVLLADLDAHGAESVLVRRLRREPRR
ncbi:hypothetical protein UO65_4603 [Actinokineospora spheciospongiae]|uniref:Uncharacterized protein n=1 Tax=Actinokineospora spheciospongiae TaxID=909613 RepID=W7IGV6_9PSEU|nr:hypothetical protein [Actinokineospora spheciospongiae]EWC60095.1 hypothetical protein UO65_4603 [Actinokineospora spheciospongiae]PWW59381.1 hypothetical protein DFQ13_10818 [Actinokineospora spheciospongiae]